MIKKERSIPLKLQKVEALARRLPVSHPKRALIEQELYNRRSGYRGEQSINYYLTFLPEKEYYILHSLRLPNHVGTFFQIDTMLISPYFITIIEVKNHGGTIRFDAKFNQLIQTHSNGNMKAYEDPISQVMRHQSQLKIWLQNNKFTGIPIHPLVVISNPSTIIETTGNSNHFKQIIHRTYLTFKMKELEKLYKVERFTKKEMTRLAKKLIKQHVPEKYNILHHFNIRPEEILTGVHCPKCSFLPMTRCYGKWICPSCKYSSKKAYEDSIMDYTLLLRTTITNKQLCDFLEVTSRTVATKLLRSMNLPHSGNTKGRVYYLEMQ